MQRIDWRTKRAIGGDLWRQPLLANAERCLVIGVIAVTAVFWFGVLQAVLRGAKLYSQDFSYAISAVIIPVGGVMAAATLGFGLLLVGVVAFRVRQQLRDW